MIGMLISVLIILVILAVICYVVNTYLPLDPGLKQLFMLIVVVIFLIWLLLIFTGQAPVFFTGTVRQH